MINYNYESHIFSKQCSVCFAAYLQEVGRAGRDGYPASAVAYFNKQDLVHVEPTMKDFIRSKECRWKFLCRHFAVPFDNRAQNEHDCCDICERMCKCNTCCLTESPLTDITKHSNENVRLSMFPVDSLLAQYFDAENAVLNINLPAAEQVSGLTQSLLRDILQNKDNITSDERFREFYPHLNLTYVANIVRILKHVL